jgi:hypothetical protein
MVPVHPAHRGRSGTLTRHKLVVQQIGGAIGDRRLSCPANLPPLIASLLARK